MLTLKPSRLVLDAGPSVYKVPDLVDALMPDASEKRIILPRLIRLRDCPYYLGMDKNRFNKEVRPQLQEIRIGEQGIAFDRLDLDQWVEYTKHQQRASYN